MVIFKGTAHPPAHRLRQNTADLCDAEIRTTNMAGRPMLLEHNYGARIGEVLTSYRGPKGDLRVVGHVTDPECEQKMRDGTLRGLSIGTGLTTAMDGKNLLRNPEELSLCAEGRRPGTWIDEIDGRRVRSVANFSKGASGSPFPHALPPRVSSPLAIPSSRLSSSRHSNRANDNARVWTEWIEDVCHRPSAPHLTYPRSLSFQAKKCPTRPRPFPKSTPSPPTQLRTWFQKNRTIG